jgi:hypothetical protein
MNVILLFALVVGGGIWILFLATRAKEKERHRLENKASEQEIEDDTEK